MYARVFTSHVMSGKGDEAVALWRDKVAPIAKRSKGFKGAYLAGDRATGKGLTITLWDSKEDADAMNASLPQSQVLFEDLWEEQPTMETYEVLFHI